MTFNFNSRDVTWREMENGDLCGDVHPRRDTDHQEHYQERRQAAELLHLMNSHNLTQVVNSATRNSEILDLVFFFNLNLFIQIHFIYTCS